MIDVAGAKGLNTVKLTEEMIGAKGVLYYQLDASEHTATRRMVIMD